MKSVIVSIDCSRIKDWDTFHDVFSEAFGFPDYYGRNMNAWIDCMTYIDDPDAEMAATHPQSGHGVTISLVNASILKARHPEIYEAVIECAAFVNFRRLEMGMSPVLLLSFHLLKSVR